MKAVIWTDVGAVADLSDRKCGDVLPLCCAAFPGGWQEVTHVAAAAGHKLQLLDFLLESCHENIPSGPGSSAGAFLTMATPRHGPDHRAAAPPRRRAKAGTAPVPLLASGAIVLVQFHCVFLADWRAPLCVRRQHSPLLAPGRTHRPHPCRSFLVREMPVGLAGLLLASIVAVAMVQRPADH